MGSATQARAAGKRRVTRELKPVTLKGTAAQLQANGFPINLAWCPQAGPQALLLACPCDDILFGGARGGGKTDGLLGDAGTYSQTWAPYFRGLLVRRTYDELDEVVARSQEIFGPLGATWQAGRYTWRFPWGGFLKLRYLKRDEDASRYQGHSYNWLGKDEGGNFPQVGPLDKLSATLRDKHGVPIREVMTANPGGPGQAWIVERYIKDRQPMVPWRDPVTGRVRVYIPSRLDDNRALTESDPGYRNRLKGSGPSWLVSAWLNGDWYATQEGGVIKSKWWMRYEVEDPDATMLEILASLPPGRIVAWVHSWDTAYKAEQVNDPSVGTVWAVMESGIGVLVDVWRKRVEYPDLKAAVVALADKWPCDKVLVEDKASGQSLIQDLKRSTKLPVHAIEPENDKVTRAVTSTLLMEAGRMWLPTRARWLVDFESELTSFPTKGVHDDQVDSVSQFLIWLRSFPLTLIPAIASAGTRVGHTTPGGKPKPQDRPEAADDADSRTQQRARASARMHRRKPRDTDGF